MPLPTFKLRRSPVRNSLFAGWPNTGVRRSPVLRTPNTELRRSPVRNSLFAGWPNTGVRRSPVLRTPNTELRRSPVRNSLFAGWPNTGVRRSPVLRTPNTELRTSAFRLPPIPTIPPKMSLGASLSAKKFVIHAEKTIFDGYLKSQEGRTA